MIVNLSGLQILERNSILDAMSAINANGKEVVFVTDVHGRVIGVVTDGDIRRGLLRGLQFEDSVAEIMNKSFTSVDQKSDRVFALDLMKAKTIRHLPIVDESGRLQGLHLLRELIGVEDRPNIAVIMAGGRGARLGSLTDACPKPMLKVANRPILERIVLHLMSAGIRDIFISLHYKGEMIRDFFGDGSRYGCRIRYIEEEEPLGTVGALSLLPETNDHPLLVMNGDLIANFDMGSFTAFHDSGRFGLSICARNHTVDIPFGVLVEKEGELVEIDEKPTKNYLVSAGIYLLEPENLALLKKNQRMDMPELIAKMKQASRRVGVHYMDEEWLDIGRQEDLRRAKGQMPGAWT